MPTEKMTKLINDVFDVMNSRRCAQAINLRNWHEKNKLLKRFLFILKETERIDREGYQQDTPKAMFMSKTTLKGWRISVSSAIALTEEMLAVDYSEILTGKFNQDPIEVQGFIFKHKFILPFLYI